MIIINVWRGLVLVACAMVLGMLFKVARIRKRNQQGSVRMLTPTDTAWAWAALVLYIALATADRFNHPLSWRLPLATVGIGWSYYALRTLVRFLDEDPARPPA